MAIKKETQVALRVHDLCKRYKIYKNPRDILWEKLLSFKRHSEFWALQDVSFEVFRGEVVGVVGRNGAGKSTLLKIISSTLTQTSGTVEVRGKVSAILELGSGFHPEYTGRENIITGGMVMGMSRQEVLQKLDSIIEFAELEDVIDQKFKTYSSGMAARLTFSTAMSVEPDIFIVDEALAAGDAFFVPKALNRIVEICQSGATVFFVSHGTDLIRRLCNRAIFLEDGRIREVGEANHIASLYEAESIKATSNYLKTLKKIDEKSLPSSDEKSEIQKEDCQGSENPIELNLTEPVKPESDNSASNFINPPESKSISVGSGELKIIQVAAFGFSNKFKEEKYSFFQNDKIKIEITLNCTITIDNPAVWIKFLRSDGVLATSWLSHEPTYINIGRLAPGEHVIALSTENILLGDGIFHVTVGLFPNKGDGTAQSAFYNDPYDLVDRVCSISIARKGRPLSTIFDQPFAISVGQGS